MRAPGQFCSFLCLTVGSERERDCEKNQETESNKREGGEIASNENDSTHNLSAISQATGKLSTHLNLIKMKAGRREKLWGGENK